MRAMINGFIYFQGVPKEIIFDNMKTVVDQSRTNYHDALINETFYRFSKDMGFEVWPCGLVGLLGLKQKAKSKH